MHLSQFFSSYVWTDSTTIYLFIFLLQEDKPSVFITPEAGALTVTTPAAVPAQVAVSIRGKVYTGYRIRAYPGY